MKSFKHEDFKVGQIILHKWGIIGEVVDTTRHKDSVDFEILAYVVGGKAEKDACCYEEVGDLWKSKTEYIEDIIGYTDNFVQPAKVEVEEDETLTTFKAELNSDVKFYGNRKDYAAFIEGAKSLFESVNRR